METITHIKFENSPADSLADSFVSTPGTAYPPLFDDTMSPVDAMTPQSYDEDHFRDSMDPSIAGTPAPEKKPVKKRKSWGQQLPEPKTNLPPRKRAKTEDEKEQRRVERVLRNRRAAQSSRERKRQEVEKLEAEKLAVERRARELESRLEEMEARNAFLQQQLEQISGGNMTVFGSSPAASSPVTELRQPTPLTFSHDLFGQRQDDNRPISTQSLPQLPVKTVNPASLSPDLRPVNESSNANSSDLTQHPAAMLCDLQYRQFVENGLPVVANQFNSEIDHMAHYNDSIIDGFTFDDFINDNDQPAPEIQSSDSLAETTASLQPQLGASS
ncbi:hypothetical protein EG329_000171 [Mollisiaceae sp. DMI_Dod_QoI]|nr:hypothetical protein EG329_000171 [Helotiales sp. DMI_Dod_QoI]